MAGLCDTSAFETFDRMAEKVEQAEAEAEAGVELAGEMTGDTLQSRFKQLENTGGADMALQELKAKMGLGPATTAPRKELPAKEGERRGRVEAQRGDVGQGLRQGRVARSQPAP